MRLQDRVCHRLKLRDLRLLLALDEWGSMAKAATHLNVTQSAVSKAITELEHTFGVPLFDRTPKGIVSTPYGRALLNCGAAVFDELRQSVNSIEHLADPARGELRVGCTEPLLWSILPTVISELVSRHPRLLFHVVPADPFVLRYRELPERKIDVAIGRIAGAVPGEDIDAEILYNEKALIVAGAQSPWTRRRKIKLADLVDEAWTLPTSGSFARQLLNEAFETNGLPPPRVNAQTFSIPLHNALLSTGNFLGVLPRTLMWSGTALLTLKVLPVKLPQRPGPVGIITLKNRTLSPVARLFIERAREVSNRLRKAGKFD